MKPKEWERMISSIMMLFLKFLAKLFLKTLKSQGCNAKMHWLYIQQNTNILPRVGKSFFILTRYMTSLLVLLLYYYGLIGQHVKFNFVISYNIYIYIYHLMVFITLCCYLFSGFFLPLHIFWILGVRTSFKY